MKHLDGTGLALCLGIIAAVCAVWFLEGCAPLPLPGNPRCFAVENCANGTVAEDPKCCVGPCMPGQHADAGPQP